MGHDGEPAPDLLEPPGWPRRVLGVVAEATVLVACVIGLCDVLWLGQLLLPWTWAVVLSLALLLLLLHRRRGLAAACLLGLLAASWPWLRAGLDPAAERLAEEAPVALRAVALDLRGFAGEPAALLAALAPTEADLVALRCDVDEALVAALKAAPGYAYERSQPLRLSVGDDSVVAGYLMVLTRQRPASLTLHLVGGSDGVVIELLPAGADAPRVLIVDAGAGSSPRAVVRQLPLIDRIAELAQRDGPLVLCQPAAWCRAAPRWRAVAAASGTTIPARGLPATRPRWLPRPLAVADTAIAVRDRALRAEGLAVPGSLRRAVVGFIGGP